MAIIKLLLGFKGMYNIQYVCWWWDRYCILYVVESKITRTIGTCFAVGYTAGWAW